MHIVECCINEPKEITNSFTPWIYASEDNFKLFVLYRITVYVYASFTG